MLVKGNKGFTLIELLIVIAIIVILAAVLIPNLLGARNRATITAAIAELRNISSAMETHMLDKGSYPNSTELADFIEDYLGNKTPKWWNGDYILSTTYYKTTETTYNITSPAATGGLLATLKIMADDDSADGLQLKHDAGVQFVNVP